MKLFTNKSANIKTEIRISETNVYYQLCNVVVIISHILRSYWLNIINNKAILFYKIFHAKRYIG